MANAFANSTIGEPIQPYYLSVLMPELVNTTGVITILFDPINIVRLIIEPFTIQWSLLRSLFLVWMFKINSSATVIRFLVIEEISYKEFSFTTGKDSDKNCLVNVMGIVKII